MPSWLLWSYPKPVAYSKATSKERYGSLSGSSVDGPERQAAGLCIVFLPF